MTDLFRIISESLFSVYNEKNNMKDPRQISTFFSVLFLIGLDSESLI